LPSIPMEEPKPKKEKISRDPVPLLAWFFVIICLIWVMYSILQKNPNAIVYFSREK
jgi:hypothetical protein